MHRQPVNMFEKFNIYFGMNKCINMWIHFIVLCEMWYMNTDDTLRKEWLLIFQNLRNMSFQSMLTTKHKVQVLKKQNKTTFLYPHPKGFNTENQVDSKFIKCLWRWLSRLKEAAYLQAVPGEECISLCVLQASDTNNFKIQDFLDAVRKGRTRTSLPRCDFCKWSAHAYFYVFMNWK